MIFSRILSGVKVLLIHLTPPPRWQKLRYQQGLGSISAVLKAAGHQTNLLVLSTFEADRLREAFTRFQPDLDGQAVSSYFESEYALNQPSVTRAQVLWYHDLFGDLVRWPRAAGLIKKLHRLKVTRTKTAWNVCRRGRAESAEWLRRLQGKK